jgi:hypothetical protein
MAHFRVEQTIAKGIIVSKDILGIEILDRYTTINRDTWPYTPGVHVDVKHRQQIARTTLHVNVGGHSGRRLRRRERAIPGAG